MSPTIKEIAKIANVSRGTVDRALNDRPGVNEDVARRIKEIAKNLGYRPNLVAKALASHHHQMTIGVVINSEGNPFFDDVLSGIREAYHEISDFGFNLEIRTMRGYDAVRQAELINELAESGINALAVTPVSDPNIKKTLNGLIHSGIPVVCFNLDLEGVDYLAYVGCDYYKSGQTLGAMIGHITGGKAHLGIVACSSNLEGHRQRINGCCNVLMNGFPNSSILQVIEAEDNEEISYQKTRDMLQTQDTLNALCFNAGGVQGGLQAVYELGFEKKLNIFTFDLTPKVIEGIQIGTVQATIDQQPHFQGYQSIRILFNALLNEIYPANKKIYTKLNIILKYNL